MTTKELQLAIFFAILFAANLCNAGSTQRDSVFCCKTSQAKTLAILQEKDSVLYSFGTKNKTDMEIRVPTDAFKWAEAWGTGDGGNGKVFCFKNLGTTYEVGYGDLNHAPYTIEASVNVIQGGKTIATIDCLKGSVRLNLRYLKAERSEGEFYELCTKKISP